MRVVFSRAYFTGNDTNTAEVVYSTYIVLADIAYLSFIAGAFAVATARHAFGAALYLVGHAFVVDAAMGFGASGIVCADRRIGSTSVVCAAAAARPRKYGNREK